MASKLVKDVARSKSHITVQLEALPSAPVTDDSLTFRFNHIPSKLALISTDKIFVSVHRADNGTTFIAYQEEGTTLLFSGGVHSGTRSFYTKAGLRPMYVVALYALDMISKELYEHNLQIIEQEIVRQRLADDRDVFNTIVKSIGLELNKAQCKKIDTYFASVNPQSSVKE